MKKIILVLLVGTCLVFKSNAQSTGALKFGPVFPTVQGKSGEPVFYPGGFFGVEFENKIYKRLSIKFGLDFLWFKAIKDKGNNKEFIENALYTNVPVSLSLALMSTDQKLYPFVDLGLNMMLNTGTEVSVSDSLQKANPKAKDNDWGPNVLVLGANYGLGLRYNVTERFFIAGRVYYNTLLSSQYRDYPDVKFHNLNCGILVGIRFKDSTE